MQCPHSVAFQNSPEFGTVIDNIRKLALIRKAPCCSECGTFDGFPYLCIGCFKHFCVLGKHCDDHSCNESLFIDTVSMKKGYCSKCKHFCSIIDQREEIPIVGFYNLGSTCYFNSVLQALFSLDYFRNYLLSDSHNESICSLKRKITKTLTNSKHFSSCLTCELIELLIRIETDEKRTPLTNEAILYATWLLSPSITGYVQHDAHEFLLWLLNQLHTETSGKCDESICYCAESGTSLSGRNRLKRTKEQLNAITIKTELQTDSATPAFCHCVSHSLFGGAELVTTSCTNCGKTCTKFEPFFVVSVDIKKHKDGQEVFFDTLEQCLDGYFSEEVFNEVHCDDCRNVCKRKSKRTIDNLPNTLFIHFKRFETKGSKRAQKIDHLVSFSEMLNVSKYVTQSVPTPKVIIKEKEKVIGEVDENPLNEYELKSVILHFGTTNTGHYQALVKRNDWYLCNDKDIEKDKLSYKNAYILVYEKKVHCFTDIKEEKDTSFNLNSAQCVFRGSQSDFIEAIENSRKK